MCQDQVVARDQRTKGIAGIRREALECCRRVDVPVDRLCLWRFGIQHRLVQQGVERADATRLDDDVGAAGVLQRTAHAILARRFVCRIHDDPRPARVVDIAMPLPIAGIGFVERHVVSEPEEGPDDSAVVGGRPVPVRRHEARAEERNCRFHATSAS
jgi:hypothetical protein